MTIEIPPCGPHCGTAAGREGHCDCTICHDGTAPSAQDAPSGPGQVRAPMADEWYAGLGDYRPWQHEHPVRPSYPDQARMLAILVPGDGDGASRWQAAEAEAGAGDPGIHHELCDVSICHPDCIVRRGRELAHWREVREVIDGTGAAG